MALNNFNELNDMHKSFLQEIGNMGAANAATEVSNMFSSPTDISTPQVRVNPAMIAGRAADMLCAGAETLSITLSGDVKGSLLFVFPYNSIERLAAPFFPGTEIKSKDDINEMVTSVMRETVNIAAASYANSMALMSGFMVDISVPNSMAAPSKELAELSGGNAVCYVKITMEFKDHPRLFDVIFYPELGTLTNFMQKMGLEC
ncbi:MAG: chemotaxis protein CheC [Ruminococcus sp.]|nr:chemotaxis protein CheC [Ruminococcus sp.]MCM1380804.1 chemotaxis protein CheC [Muribaculaceae bacterium]MCM1479643.1 chemotaxis protein CheC [Muribaculaceae bacterium]